MIFQETNIHGVFIVDLKRIEDHRGYFGRVWCQKEFGELGLNINVAQTNVGFSHKRGTLRGIHFQRSPHQEAKLVRCTLGAIFDVAVDLRIGSPTHRKWVGVELSSENGRMLYVPEGCGHGYQTLADNTEMYYQTSAFYAPESAGGVRFDDAAFRIGWSLPVSVISDNDARWPDYGAGID